jgi:hypothetical protein
VFLAESFEFVLLTFYGDGDGDVIIAFPVFIFFLVGGLVSFGALLFFVNKGTSAFMSLAGTLLFLVDLLIKYDKNDYNIWRVKLLLNRIIRKYHIL